MIKAASTKPGHNLVVRQFWKASIALLSAFFFATLLPRSEHTLGIKVAVLTRGHSVKIEWVYSPSKEAMSDGIWSEGGTSIDLQPVCFVLET